ncbi:MAG: redoxin domain-containing protein [Sphingobacteriales bacterium]|jgi:peroxiredoxin|nr:redoxin domain-containing protein [Sphingobacteriales bacterium]
MIKHFLLWAITLFSFLSVQAEKLRISISDSLLTKPAYLWIKYYENGILSTKDSVLVSNENKDSLLFDMANYKGYCELHYKKNDKDGLGFLFNPLEKNVKLELKIVLEKKELIITNSLDNIIGNQLIDISNKIYEALNKIQYNAATLSRFDSLYLNKSLGFERQREKLHDAMNLMCDSASKDNAVLFASVLADFLKIPSAATTPELKKYFDNYDAMLHWHYFDYIDFKNPLILNHPVFNAKIIKYFSDYCDNSNISLNEGIDILMKKSQANETVRNYVFNFLVDYFLKRNNDPEVAYLNEQYADGCGIKLSTEKLKEFSGIIQTQTGAKIPDVISYDAKNEIRSLYNEAEKNKFTVVYIWMSSCHACQTKTPQLMEMLAQFQKKGVGILSVSLDEKKENWLLAIQKYKIERWINVAELKPVQESSVIPKLNIRTTPKLFIIDNTGKIIAKDVFGSDLQAMLNQLLK